MSWRDNIPEEREGFGLGQIDNGEITVTFENEGETIDTEYGEAVRFEVVYEDGPDYMETTNDDTLEPGNQYHLISSSNRFLRNLAEYGDELTGETVAIEAQGEDFDRYYSVDIA